MLAEDGGEFEVTVPIARGSVAHKAIELAIHWKGEPVPLDLVDEAMARLTESDSWMTDWLRTCGDTDAGGASERGRRSGQQVPRMLPAAAGEVASGDGEPPDRGPVRRADPAVGQGRPHDRHGLTGGGPAR